MFLLESTDLWYKDQALSKKKLGLGTEESLHF